jgi:hypothetical protein
MRRSGQQRLYFAGVLFPICTVAEQVAEVAEVLTTPRWRRSIQVNKSSSKLCLRAL